MAVGSILAALGAAALFFAARARAEQKRPPRWFWVATWTVQPDKLEEHDGKALPALLAHDKNEKLHGRVISAHTYAVQWGSEPARPGRVWIEEFETLADVEADLNIEATAPECKEAWGRIHALAVPGTFRTAIWRDPLRAAWKDPPLARPAAQ